MAALLDMDTLLDAWILRKPIATLGQVQSYEAEHIHTGAHAIVVCTKRVNDVRIKSRENRITLLQWLREMPQSRMIPVLNAGELDSLEWVAVAAPPRGTIKLSDCLIQDGPLSERLAAALIRDLLESLSPSHPHLWLRPAALWLNRERALCAISDHGLPHLFSHVPALFDPCTAPEQHARQNDVRSDVYACGVILFQALTGFEPFYDDQNYNARAMLEPLPSVTLERPSLQYAQAFDRLIELLTRKLPGQRPSAALALDEARRLAKRLNAPKPAPKPRFEICLEAREEDPLDLLVPVSMRRPMANACPNAEVKPNAETKREALSIEDFEVDEIIAEEEGEEASAETEASVEAEARRAATQELIQDLFEQFGVGKGEAPNKPEETAESTGPEGSCPSKGASKKVHSTLPAALGAVMLCCFGLVDVPKTKAPREMPEEAPAATPWMTAELSHQSSEAPEPICPAPAATPIAPIAPPAPSPHEPAAQAPQQKTKTQARKSPQNPYGNPDAYVYSRFLK